MATRYQEIYQRSLKDAEGFWSDDDRSRGFLNASRLALRDGQLSNGEKRILVKLAHALSLEEGEPKRIYDAILSG